MSDEEPRLQETGRGLTIRYKGRHLYSSRDPLAGPRRLAAEAPLAPGTLVYVPSLGLGYGLQELLARLPESCHVLCVEVDPALLAVFAASRATLPRSERLSVVRLDDSIQAAGVLQTLGPWRFRRVTTLALCGGCRLEPDAYRRIQQTLEEELRLYWQNRITLIEMSGLWLRNLFANLALLPGAGGIDSLHTGRAIVVAGAGPSLERTLPAIQRIRKRVCLLAADTALPTLAAAGLRPDWVCVLESQVHNLDDFVPAYDPSLWLLCDLTASPTVLRRFPLRSFFLSRFYPLELFPRLDRFGLLPPSLPPLGSVGVTAVQLALRLTRGPVFLAGLDFCYQPGKTHARGAPAHLRALTQSRRLRPAGMYPFEALLLRPRLELRGRLGTTVTSDLVLRSYALQLQRLVEGYGRVYDLGGEGLPCGATVLSDGAATDRVLDAAQPGAELPGQPGAELPGQPGAELPGQPGAAEAPQPQPLFAPDLAGVVAFCQAESAVLRRSEQELLELLKRASSGAPRDSAHAPALGQDAPGRQDLPEWLRETEYLLLPHGQADPGRMLMPGILRQALAGARFFTALLEGMRTRLNAPAEG